MAHPAQIQEVISGQQAYRQDLADSFSHAQGAVDFQEVRQCLANEGIVSQTQLVTIPFTLEGLQHASGLKEKHRWSDPFVTERIDKALVACKERGAGLTAAEVDYAQGFWSVVLNVAVIFDDVELNAKDFGNINATGQAITLGAHEITHSSFANISSKRYDEVGENRIEVLDLFAIGQAPETTIIEPYGGRAPVYEPIWIDEAVAQYMASEVRQQIQPQSIPTNSRSFDYARYGAGKVEIPPKYLVYSEVYPDYPGSFGSVEGVGMDILTSKYPDLLPQIKSLTTDELAITDFHENLREWVGSELYASITNRKPYTAWGSILKQIIDL